MCLYGGLGEHEVLGDLSVGEAARNQQEDLVLTRGQQAQSLILAMIGVSGSREAVGIGG